MKDAADLGALLMSLGGSGMVALLLAMMWEVFYGL